MRPAVFLDRDGTMIHEAQYLSRLEDLHWFASTADAVRLMNRAGFLVCVTTNQGGIGLGLFTAAFVDELHGLMADYLKVRGADVAGWFYCPHHPNAIIEGLRVDCDCRKPRPGLVNRAARQFDIDLARSFVIGDKAADLELAANVGARGVLVRTGYGEELVRSEDAAVSGAAYVAEDLMEATAWLLGQSGHPVSD